MKKKPASKSAFFNPRVLISFAFCSVGVLLALVGFALYPGGNAFARQNQSVAPAAVEQNVPVSEASVADVRATAFVEEDGASLDSVAPTGPAQPDVIGATFVVNTTADTADAAPGDGACADSTGACSLRAAISEANALAGPDTITIRPVVLYDDAGGSE